MKSMILLILFTNLSIFATVKTLPPGSGVTIEPNVLFIIDNSGSMEWCDIETAPNIWRVCYDGWNGWNHYTDNPHTSCQCKDGSGTHYDRIKQTKQAINALLSDTNITKSIRIGLSQFPNGGNDKQLLQNIDYSTTEHINKLKTEINNINANGGTPISNSLRGGGHYYYGAGINNTQTTQNIFQNTYDSSKKTPIIHKCQKNYIVLFTDGEPDGGTTGRDQAANKAEQLFNNYLSSFKVDGEALFDTKIRTYAVGFGSTATNVDYIADPGGTGHGRNAKNSDDLIAVFNEVVTEIAQNNITSTMPTMVVSFDGPNEDVIYQSLFVPRQGKQWEGHFYKYEFKDGWADDKKWDSGDSSIIGKANERNIFTRCFGGKDDGELVTKFEAEKDNILADCLMMEGQSGAGTPINVCYTTTYDWEEWVNSNWQPQRDGSNFNCRNNTYNEILNSFDSYKFLCITMEDFAYHSGGDCTGNPITDAKLIERYLCQANNACDCYKAWKPESQKAKICFLDTDCIEVSEPNAQCIYDSISNKNYCTGGIVFDEETGERYPNSWEEHFNTNYKDNIDELKVVGNTSDEYNSIELYFEDLKFSSNDNDNINRVFQDYLEIEGETTDSLKYYYYVVDNGKMFDCGTTKATKNPLKIPITCQYKGDMMDGVISIPRGGANLKFHSNPQGNDIALKLVKYRVKKAPTVSCRWEPAGPGSDHTEEMYKNARKLIHFFRGKDSYMEDTKYTNLDVCSGKIAGDDCPERKYPLSDIYNSRAKYFGKPNQFFTFESYKEFIEDYSERVPMLIVGSNGGMIHAFNANTGKESWAFVPPNLLPYLKNIVSSESGKTESQFFVDRSPKIMDVFDGDNWRSILLITFGEGGAGLMALDITTVTADGPTFLWAIYNESPWIENSEIFSGWSNKSELRRVLYWNSEGKIKVFSKKIRENAPSGIDSELLNKIAGDDLSTNPAFDYSNLYYTWSEPIIAQIGSDKNTPGRFVGVMGGGGLSEEKINIYGSSIYMFDVLSGSLIKTFDIENSNPNVSARVPATVAILPEPDLADNREIKLIYVADLAGHLWRINPKKGDLSVTEKHVCSNSSTNSDGCLMLFNVNADKTRKNYVYNSIALAYDGNPSTPETALWIYLGTGDSNIHDLAKDEGKNTLYAIKDSTWDTQNSDLRILESELDTISKIYSSSCSKKNKGWIYKLEDGEKLVDIPAIIEGYSYFTVYKHDVGSGGVCDASLGKSYVYSFELFSGCFNPDFIKNSSDPTPKGFLGKGVATAPVMKGEYMYFGISGKTDSENNGDRFDGMDRKDNLIRWERKSASTTGTSDVPFTYFKEIF
ncbi:VWA domain-containing protein [bacterium]|nr:VWA domain-containing protein [bacterium]